MFRKWRRLIGIETHSNKKKSKKKTLYTLKIKVEKEKGWSQKQINEIVPMKVCIDIIVLCACVWREREKGGVLLYITSDTIHFWYGETVVEGMAISWHVVLYENRNCHHIPNKPICAKKFTILSTAEWLLICQEY